MGQQVTEKKLLSTDQWIKIALIVFGVGAGWTRLEYQFDKASDKMDQANERLANMMEKHIIQDQADKTMMNFKHEQLVQRVELDQATLKLLSERLSKK